MSLENISLNLLISQMRKQSYRWHAPFSRPHSWLINSTDTYQGAENTTVHKTDKPFGVYGLARNRMPFFGSVSNYLLFNDLFKQKTPPVPILSLSIFRNKGLLHVKSIQFNNLSLTHLKYTSSHDTSFFLMGLLLMLFALA